MRDGHARQGHAERRTRRPFDYGALRLFALGLIAERPRHGYELMRAIEERSGGGYSPSPGAVYPMLSWLEDMGYARPEAEGGRRSYRITPEGEAFLAANRQTLDALSSRMNAPCGGGRRRAPEPVLRGMETLKRALRMRFLSGEVDDPAIARIAAVLERAAREIENDEEKTE